MTIWPDFDDPSFYAGSPDEALAQLRREHPVHRDPAGFWVLTRHADIRSVERDQERFCSGQGVLLADRHREVTAADSILYLDPPDHGRHRQLLNRAFTPRTVARLEPTVRALAAELMDAVEPAVPVDVVDSLAAPLPLLVIAELLGVPATDREEFRRWSDAVMAAATDLTEENALLAAELFAYFDAHLARREEQPTGDLLTALVEAEVDGTRLSRQEQLGFCMTLLVAGNETTRALIAGGLLALAEHPDQRARLSSEPGLIPNAVEEMLRWVTPIMAMARTTTSPVTFGEQEIPAGEYLLLSYAAANRDEAAFGPDSARFDVSREPNPHLAFGSGGHFCLGAGLARLEARIVFEEVLARWPDYRLAGPPEPVPSTLLRQIAHLPVLFDPAAAEPGALLADMAAEAGNPSKADRRWARRALGLD